MDDKNMSVSNTHDTERDFFTEIYQQYQNSEYVKGLHSKYTERPYFVKHKNAKLLALVTSYLFNVLSGISACVPVYFLVLNLSGLKVVSILSSLLFLGLFEITKRLIAANFFREKISSKKINLVLFLPLTIMVVLSVSLSYTGGKQLVHISETPPKPIAENTKVADIATRIKILTKQIEEARQAKYYNGTTTKESRQTISILTQQIADLEKDKSLLEKINRDENSIAKNTWKTQYETKLFWFPLGTLLFEVWFLFSIWYIEYFDWRSWVEFVGVRRVHTRKTVSTPHVYEENSDKPFDLKYIKSRIATAKYRLKNGIGNEETNRKNLEEFMKLIESK